MRQGQQDIDGLAAPATVDTKRQKMIQQVVFGRDVVEHALHLLTFGGIGIVWFDVFLGVTH